MASCGQCGAKKGHLDGCPVNDRNAKRGKYKLKALPKGKVDPREEKQIKWEKTTCPTCNGSGKRGIRTCGLCNGRGTISTIK